MREATSAETRGLARELDRHWLRLVLIAWAAMAAWYLWDRSANIRWLVLTDTDDNMRLAQVRAWMAGQGWFDLRQYRLDPPRGFDIHWSRIVDLPLAALILFFRLFTTAAWAERLACGVAPLLPLGVVLGALAATVRRLVHPLSWPLALVFVPGATATILMFMPMRVDHHGWQLACLALTVAGLCDPRQVRGGLIVGLASAVSLAIGLEMLPYVAMAGAILALRWVWDGAEATRLQVYALSLGGGGAIGYAAFASHANRVPRCDALTPVYLGVLVAGGALLFVLARLGPARWQLRLALAVAAGGAIAIGFALAFPQCLGRPEQVSPELARLWLDNVREAKPIYRHPLRSAFPIATLPVIGFVGAAIAAWQARRGPTAIGWAAVALFTAFAAAMLLWQVRSGPAAQLLAIPGAVALGWWLLPWFLAHPVMPVRVFGTVGAFLFVSGLFSGLVIRQIPSARATPYQMRVNGAGARCNSYTAMTALDRYPAATVFTFNDLGPRLIVLTHHSAVSGPYHRNGQAILDVHHAWGGPPELARTLIRRHGATLLLTCPNMAESTIYRSRNRTGFYARLARGEVPAWLEPLPLPAGSPFRLWQVRN